MKIWTYAEAKAKIEVDLDLEDEIFIKPDELVGYFNEGLEEAESEIHVLSEDYFLTKYFIPFVIDVSEYLLPDNIYANRIRKIMYHNNDIIYPITQFRRMFKFEEFTDMLQYPPNEDYKYLLQNDVVGQAKMVMQPAARENAILAPYADRFTPATMWYVRNCSRIPIIGEYCNKEIIATSQVDIGADTIQTYAGTTTVGIPQQGSPGSSPGSIAYITGNKVKFQPGPTGTVPGGLTAGQVYYVIALGSGLIQVALTLADARAGTFIDLTSVGTVYFSMQVAATAAIQDATLLDIPEFTKFVIQWARCRCFEKEGDPRLPGAASLLVQQKKQMVDTLTKRIDDDDDRIQPDLSPYWDMSLFGW